MHVIFPGTVLTCSCHLRGKSPPLCVLPGRQCHSTMYKHEKAHQGNWGFNNQSLSARQDQWFQMEVQGQREGGRRRGSNHSAASVLSGAVNEPRILQECVPAGFQILVVLQHPSTQGSHAGAPTTVSLCSLGPNERFNFKICAQHHFYLLVTLHGRKTSLEAEYIFCDCSPALHRLEELFYLGVGQQTEMERKLPTWMGWLHFLSTPGKYGFNIFYLCSKRWNGKFQSDTMEHSLNIAVMCSCFHNGSDFCYWPIPYYYFCFQQSSESPRHTVIDKILLQCNLVLLHVFSFFARWFCVMFEPNPKSFIHTYKKNPPTIQIKI